MANYLKHLLTAFLLTTSILSYGTIDLDSLNDVAFGYLFSNPDSAFILAEQEYVLSEKDSNKYQMGIALITQGHSFYMRGDYAMALKSYNKSLLLKEEIKDQEGIAVACIGIGNIYVTQGDQDEGSRWYHKSLKIYQELKDEKNIALIYINIGATKQQSNDRYSALVYYNKALDVYKKLNRKDGIITCKTNIGVIYSEYKDYDKALKNYNTALELSQEIGDMQSTGNNYTNIGTVQGMMGMMDEATENLLKGLEIAKEFGFLFREKESYISLSDLYAKDNDHKQALSYYKLYTSTKDSLFNEDKSKEIGRIEAVHEFDMDQMEHKREQQEIEQQQATAKSRSDNLQYSGILIFLVAIFTAVFMIGKFSIPIKLAEGLIFFAFLLFFEFMLVMLDPYIEDYSNGAPAIKLLFNAILAGLIFPLHSLFESKMKSRVL